MLSAAKTNRSLMPQEYKFHHAPASAHQDDYSFQPARSRSNVPGCWSALVRDVPHADLNRCSAGVRQDDPGRRLGTVSPTPLAWLSLQPADHTRAVSLSPDSSSANHCAQIGQTTLALLHGGSPDGALFALSTTWPKWTAILPCSSMITIASTARKSLKSCNFCSNSILPTFT